MTALRLLLVVQRYGPEVRGGAEQAARTVAERLAARGHLVEVLTTTATSYVDWSGELPAGREVVNGVVVHRLPVDPKRDPDVFGRLHTRLEAAEAPVATELERDWLAAQGPSVPGLEAWLDAEAGRFDVAVFFTYLYATTTDGLPVAARHTATALVPCAHDEPPLALHVFDRIAHLADALLFLTPEEADLVRARFRLRTPHHVVGLGTDLDVGTAGDDPGAFAASHGIEGDPYLLYVGRIDPSKGTSWLVEQFTALKAERPSRLRLVLLGEAVVPPEPHRDVLVVTDADDVTRNEAMAGAVALVHPSPYESFGMVLTETFALGTPAIAFGGNEVLRGRVERSGAGVLVRSGAELGAAAELLRSDTPLRDALGSAGRTHVEAHHSWPHVIAGWERALQRTAASPGRIAPPPAPARPLDPVAPDHAGTTGVAAHDATQAEAEVERADLPPAWLVRPLAAALGLLAGLSIVGVVAAMAEVFEPAIVLGGTAVVGGPLGWLAARAVPRWSSPRATHAAAALVLVVIGAITANNLANHSQHVIADRDPGIYLTTAKHLLDDGDLLVPGPTGPFAEADEGISPNGAGFSNERDDGTLEPQFPHLTAVLLAAGGWLGEGGLFLLTPLIAAVGLLCLYAWATGTIGARWALVPVAVTGVSMPFMVFARDTYSEPIAMVVVFGGLWLLQVADRSRRAPVWLLAGLVLGTASMARVDGFLYLAPVLLALTLATRLAGPGRRRRAAGHLVWCTVGLAVTSAIGWWDTYSLTGGYYDEGLGPRLPAMLAAGAVAAVLGWFAAPALWRRAVGTDTAGPAPVGTAPIGSAPVGTAPIGTAPIGTAPIGSAPVGTARVRPNPVGSAPVGSAPAPTGPLVPTRWLQGLVTVMAVGLAGFFAWAYWIRPDREGLPDVAVEGLNVLSYLPQAKTMSLHWLAWYVAPFGLAAGLAGLLWLLVRLGWARRLEPAAVAGLAAIFVTLLLYLWTPSVTPDQPWAMRRFAPVALPGLGIGAAALAQALWQLGQRRPALRPRTDDAPPRRRRRLAQQGLAGLLALGVAGGTIGATAAITWPVRDARAQIPMRHRMQDLCAAVGDDAAVLVPIDGILALMASVPVGVWCDVPSAGGTTRLEPETVAELAVEWAEKGRRLVVVSSSETPLMNELLPTGIVPATIELKPTYPEAIEPTITSRPERIVVDGRLGKGPDGEITFYVYPIDVDAARWYLG